MPTKITLLTNLIWLDEKHQMRRDGLDRERVEAYADDMRRGDEFPPVVCYLTDDSRYICLDGFHRTEAARLADVSMLKALVFDSLIEAQTAAFDEQLKHGKELAIYDKKTIFLSRAYSGGDWYELSNREIARRMRVSHSLVGLWANDFAHERGLFRPNIRRDHKGRLIDTSNIGNSPKQNPDYPNATRPVTGIAGRAEPEGREEGLGVGLTVDHIHQYPRQIRNKLHTLINLGILTQDLTELHTFEEVEPSDQFHTGVRDTVTGIIYGGPTPRPADVIHQQKEAERLAALRLNRAAQTREEGVVPALAAKYEITIQNIAAAFLGMSENISAIRALPTPRRQSVLAQLEALSTRADHYRHQILKGE